MGLISRVSSRTYSFFNFRYVMKRAVVRLLKYAFLIACIYAVYRLLGDSDFIGPKSEIDKSLDAILTKLDHGLDQENRLHQEIEEIDSLVKNSLIEENKINDDKIQVLKSDAES